MVSINSEELNTFQEDVHDEIVMSMPSKAEYVGVVRLTVSAIANRMGFNIEDIEDIKVAVAEACTNAIRHSENHDFKVSFQVFEDKMGISISDEGKGYQIDEMDDPDLNNPKEEGGLGIFIIKSLMDEVDMISKVGEGTQIKMIKFLGDGN